MSMVEAGLVCELGAALHPGPWLSSAVAAPRALARFGASEEAGELFGAIATGSTIATVAVPGHDDGPVTVGRRGGRLGLSGAFAGVPDAAAADVLLVVVVAGEHARMDLFTVPSSAPTVEIIECTGIDKSLKMFRVDLRDAEAYRVGTGAGQALQALVDDVIIAWGADALGAARRVLERPSTTRRCVASLARPSAAFRRSPNCAWTCTRRRARAKRRAVRPLGGGRG